MTLYLSSPLYSVISHVFLISQLMLFWMQYFLTSLNAWVVLLYLFSNIIPKGENLSISRSSLIIKQSLSSFCSSLEFRIDNFKHDSLSYSIKLVFLYAFNFSNLSMQSLLLKSNGITSFIRFSVLSSFVFDLNILSMTLLPSSFVIFRCFMYRRAKRLRIVNW